jgi:hypothetical protein
MKLEVAMAKMCVHVKQNTCRALYRFVCPYIKNDPASGNYSVGYNMGFGESTVKKLLFDYPLLVHIKLCGNTDWYAICKTCYGRFVQTNSEKERELKVLICSQNTQQHVERTFV